MACKHCGRGDHHTSEHYELKDKLERDGRPKGYASAHESADKAEKKKFGAKSYDAMKKVDNKLGKNELAGNNFRSGEIDVSKKVPKKYRSEVAYHERFESGVLQQRRRKK